MNKYNELVQVVNDKDDNIKKWICIFDIAIQEIVGLIKTDSLARFYKTNEYKIFASQRK